MRKVLCLLLSCLLIVSGCSEHLSDHCIEISGEITLSAELRENYNPALTPITDLAGECYCQVEDAVFVSLMAVVWVGFGFLQAMAESPPPHIGIELLTVC